MNIPHKERGAAHLLLILALVVGLVGVLGFLGFNAWQKQNANAGGEDTVAARAVSVASLCGAGYKKVTSGYYWHDSPMQVHWATNKNKKMVCAVGIATKTAAEDKKLKPMRLSMDSHTQRDKIVDKDSVSGSYKVHTPPVLVKYNSDVSGIRTEWTITYRIGDHGTTYSNATGLQLDYFMRTSE